MAKKENFKKAKVSKVKLPSTGAWLTKAGKSVGLAAFDVLKEMMPATADTVSSASDAVSELRDELMNMKTQGASSDNVIAQTLYSGKETITNATKSILADLKEGNLYKSPGSDMGDDFDMSDFDIGDDSDYDTSFQSEDGSTQVTTSKANQDGGNDVTKVNVNVNIGEDSPMVNAVKNQTRVATDSAKAQLEYTKLNDSNMMKSFISLKSLLRGNLGSIDSNLGNISTGITTIAQASSVSLKYYDDSMEVMNSINQNLAFIKEYMTQPKTMTGGVYGDNPDVLDMFTASGGLDFSAYLKTVKNQASMAMDNNIILSTVKSFFENKDMIAQMSPVSIATEAVVKKLVPGILKQAAESFDRTLGESAISFLYRLRGIGNNSDNPLIQFLGDTFGIDNRYKDRVDKSNYNRGKVDWNGQSHKTLNEVIPYYLRQISSSLSGRDEKVFDYDRGIFRDLQDVVAEYKEMDKSITLDGFTGVLDDFRDYMDNINVQFSDTNIEEAVNKSMERFLTTLVKNNSGGMMKLTDTGDGTMSFLDSVSRVLGTSTDDDAAKLIASFFDSNDRSYTMSAFGRKILEARANATKTRNAIESNAMASNSMYVDNGADNSPKKLSYKKSPFVETDSYGKTPIYYMKNIYRLLAEGIRVFPETSMNGGGGGSKYYDKVLANFNNLESEKKSNKARQAAGSARAMTREEENYIKESGGFVIGNGNDTSLKALTAAGKDYQKQLKDEELDENNRASLFNKLTGLGSDTVLSKIVNTTVTAINKPSKLLAGVFDYLDNQLFNIVFGGKTGPRGSIVNTAMTFMKDKFAEFSTWLNDKILTPVYDSLFGEDGLLAQIKNSEVAEFAKAEWKKFREYMFGKEDENGKLVGGLFPEFGNDLNKIGKELYDKILGDNPDSYWSGAKRQFGEMFNGVTKAFGYDLVEARKRREKTGKGPISQMLDDVSGAVKGRFRAWTDALLGPEADPKAMTTQLARGIKADMEGMDTNKIGSSAMFGLITSLFLPGGPVLHMLLGAGKSFVKQSETLQVMLFGEKDENGKRKGRFISRELIDIFNENKTGIKFGLGAGLLAGMGILPGLAGGSITYAIAGGAASFVYNMDSIQEMLFGPKDDNGQRVGGGFVDRFKKAIGETHSIKTFGIDAGVGAGIGILGSMFLPGGPLLWGLTGSIMGIVATTDKFKNFMFGSIDEETGKRKGGMLPKMYEQLMGPIKNTIYATQVKAISFLEERVVTPMATAISPILAQVNYLIEDVKSGINNTVRFVQDRLMDFVLKPAGKATRMIFAPFIKATKTMFKAFMNITGKLLTSPFSLMKYAGYGLNALHRVRGSKDFKKNTIKNALTFNKRKREKLGLTDEQGKLGNRLKSFAKYYSLKARKNAKVGDEGAWYNKKGMTSRQEQKKRVKELRAWRNYRLKELKKDAEKRFTKEDRAAFDKKHGYMQWWQSNTAKPKVKQPVVDTKKKLAEIQSDKSTVNTKNVILNYTGTLKHKGTGTGVSASEIKGKMATGGTVPSTGVYMLSKGEKVIPNDNVSESIKKENLLMKSIRENNAKKKAKRRRDNQLKYLKLENASQEELAQTLQSNLTDEDQDEFIARNKKMDKLRRKSQKGWFEFTRNRAARKLDAMQLEDKQNRVLGMQDEYRTRINAYKAVIEIKDILKGFKKHHEIKAGDIKGKKATGGIVSQTGAYILSKGEKVIPVAKRGLNKVKAAEEVAYQNIKSGATTAYNAAASAGQTVVSTLHAKAQQALATGNRYFLDAKGRVLDASEVVKGNMTAAYSKAKVAGGKALEQAKAYGQQALNKGKDVYASLQAQAQAALQKGQTVFTDAKGRVLDAAEVLKGNIVDAYGKAKVAGTQALNTAQQYGTQAWNTTKAYAGQAWNTAKGYGTQAWNTAKGYGQQAATKAGQLASQAKVAGTQALNTAKTTAGQAWNTAKGYGTQAWNTAQMYGKRAATKAGQLASQAKATGTQALNTVQMYGTQALNTAKGYGAQIATKAGQLASQAKVVGTQALNTAQMYGTHALGAAKAYGSHALAAGQAGLSSLASSASALPGMLGTALSGVSLPTVGLAAGGLLAAGALGFGAKKLYDRHKKKKQAKALQQSDIKGRMAEGGTVKRDGAYILSAGEKVVPVQPNGVAKVIIDLKENSAAAKAGKAADFENANPLAKVTQQQAAFMKQQVEQMGQMLDLQRIIRSDVDAEKAYKVEQRRLKKAGKSKRKTSAKARLKEAEQLRKAQEKGRYQTLKKLQDEQKQKEKLYKAIFDIKDNTFEMIDKQDKVRLDWKEIFGKKKGLLFLSLITVVPAILNVVRNYKTIFAKVGGYAKSLSDRVGRAVDMAGGMAGIFNKIKDTFDKLVTWFKDPEARKKSLEDFMDNAKDDKEQLKTYAREAYHKARYGTYETMEGIKQNTLGASNTDAFGPKIGQKAKKVGHRAIQRLATTPISKFMKSRVGQGYMDNGLTAFSGSEIKQGFTKVKDGIRSGAQQGSSAVKGFVDDVTGTTARNAQKNLVNEASKIRTVDVRGKVGSYRYYLNDWKLNGDKYLAEGRKKLSAKEYQKLYDAKVAEKAATQSDNVFSTEAKRAYRKYAKQAGANAVSMEEFMSRNGSKFATSSADDIAMKRAYKTYAKKAGSTAMSMDDFIAKNGSKFTKSATASVDDVARSMAGTATKTKAGRVVNTTKDIGTKVGTKLKVGERITGTKKGLRNAASKLGSTVRGFTDDVAKSGVKQATKTTTKKVTSDMMGSAKRVGTKVASKVKNVVSADTAQQATKYLDDMFKWLGKSIKSLAAKFGGANADNIIAKIVSKFGKLIQTGKAFKEFSVRLSKTLVKGAAKLATGLNIVMGVGGAIFGAFDAANLFAVDKSQVDVKMRAISAVWASLKNLSIIASVVDLVNEILYSIMGISFIREVSVMLYTFLSTPEESDNLDKAMKDFEDEYNNAVSKEYQEFLKSDEGKKTLVTEKDENGNTIQRQMTLEEFKKSGKGTTFQEYNNAKHKTVGTKIKTAVSGVKDKITKTAYSVAGWKDRKWSELGSGYFNVDEMNEDGTMKTQSEIMKERGKKILLFPIEVFKTTVGSVMKVIDPFIKILKGVLKGFGDSLIGGSKEMFSKGITHIMSPSYWTNPNKVDDEAGAIANIGFYAGRVLTLLFTVPAGVLGSVWKIVKGVVNGIKKMGAALIHDSQTGFGSITSVKDVYSSKYWTIPEDEDSEFSALRKIAFYINRVVMLIPSTFVGLVHDAAGVLDPIIKPIRNAISGLTDKIDIDDNGISDMKEDQVGGMNKIIYYTSKFFTIGASIFRGILKKVNAFMAPIVTSLKNSVGAIPQILLDSVGKNPFDGDYWAYKAPDNGEGGMLHKIAFYVTKVISMPITLMTSIFKTNARMQGGVFGAIVDNAKAIGTDIGSALKFALSGKNLFSNEYWTLKDDTGEGLGPLRKIIFFATRVMTFPTMAVINLVAKVKDKIGPIMDTVKTTATQLITDFKEGSSIAFSDPQATFGSAYWTINGDTEEGFGPLRKITFYATRILMFPVLTPIAVIRNLLKSLSPVFDSIKTAIDGVKAALNDGKDDGTELSDGEMNGAPKVAGDSSFTIPMSTIAYYAKKILVVPFKVIGTTLKVAFAIIGPILNTLIRTTGFILEDLATGISTAATKGTISKEYWTIPGGNNEEGGFWFLRPISFYTLRIGLFFPLTMLSIWTTIFNNMKPIIDGAKFVGNAVMDDAKSFVTSTTGKMMGVLSKDYWVLNGDQADDGGFGPLRKIMFYTGRIVYLPAALILSYVSTPFHAIKKIIDGAQAAWKYMHEDSATAKDIAGSDPGKVFTAEYWKVPNDDDGNQFSGFRKFMFYTTRIALAIPMGTSAIAGKLGEIGNSIKQSIGTTIDNIKSDSASATDMIQSNPSSIFTAEYWKVPNDDNGNQFSGFRKVLFYGARIAMIFVNGFGAIGGIINDKVIEPLKTIGTTLGGYIKEDVMSGIDAVGTNPFAVFTPKYWTMTGNETKGYNVFRKIFFGINRWVMLPVNMVIAAGMWVKEKLIDPIIDTAKKVGAAVKQDAVEGVQIALETQNLMPGSPYWQYNGEENGLGGFRKIIFFATRFVLAPFLLIGGAIMLIVDQVSKFFDKVKLTGSLIADDVTKGASLATDPSTSFEQLWTMDNPNEGFSGVRKIIFGITRFFLSPVLGVTIATEHVSKKFNEISSKFKSTFSLISADFTETSRLIDGATSIPGDYWNMKGGNISGLGGGVRSTLFYIVRFFALPVIGVNALVDSVSTKFNEISNKFKATFGLISSDITETSMMIDNATSIPGDYWNMKGGNVSGFGGGVRTTLFYIMRFFALPVIGVNALIKSVSDKVESIGHSISAIKETYNQDLASSVQAADDAGGVGIGSEYWTYTGSDVDGIGGGLRKFLFYAARAVMAPVIFTNMTIGSVAEKLGNIMDRIKLTFEFIGKDRDDAHKLADNATSIPDNYWTMKDNIGGFGQALRTTMFYINRTLLLPNILVNWVVAGVTSFYDNTVGAIKHTIDQIGEMREDTLNNNSARDVFSLKYWTMPTRQNGTGFGLLYNIMFYTSRIMCVGPLLMEGIFNTVSKIFEEFANLGKWLQDTVDKSNKVDGLGIQDWFDMTKAGIKQRSGIARAIDWIIFHVVRVFKIIPNIFDLAWNTIKNTGGNLKDRALDFVSRIGSEFKEFLGLGGNGNGRTIGGNGEKSPQTQNGFAYYSQNDPSIKNSPYKLSSGASNTTGIPQNMGSRGCGPTAMAMVATQLNGGMGGNGPANSKADTNPYSPTNMARMAEEQHYSTSKGTMPGYFTSVGSQLGMNVTPTVASPDSISALLNSGQPVIIQGKSANANSPYTSGGHYVVAVGMGKDGKVKVNDPRGKKYSKEYSMNDIMDGSAMAWGFSKPGASVSDKKLKKKLYNTSKSSNMGGTGPVDKALSGVDKNYKPSNYVTLSNGGTITLEEYNKYAAQASAMMRLKLSYLNKKINMDQWISNQRQIESSLPSYQQSIFRQYRETASSVLKSGVPSVWKSERVEKLRPSITKINASVKVPAIRSLIEKNSPDAIVYADGSVGASNGTYRDLMRDLNSGGSSLTSDDIKGYFAQASLDGNFRWDAKYNKKTKKDGMSFLEQMNKFNLRGYITKMQNQEKYASPTYREQVAAIRAQAVKNWTENRKPWDNGDGTYLTYKFMDKKEKKRLKKEGKLVDKASNTASSSMALISEQSIVADAASGAASSSGGWVDVIKAVKKAIADQKPGYDTGKYIVINVGTGDIKTRTDCSGFVSACLIAFGKLKSGAMLSSANFSNQNDSNMKSTGFYAMDWPGWDNLVEGDIIAKTGHVEIFARNEGSNTHYVYNAGSKDAINNPDATRSSKPEYTTVWRCTDSSSVSLNGSSSTVSSNSDTSSNTLAGRLAALANAMIAPIKGYLYGDSGSTDSGSSNTGTSISGGATIDLPGGDVPEKVWNYFKGLNYSDAAVAGIMGNLYQESKMNPSCVQSNGKGPAAGIAQWEDYNLKTERWANLDKRAKKKGVPWTDLPTQLDFLRAELESADMSNRFSGKTAPSNLSKAGTTGISFDDWKNTTDVENATRQFEAAFERAGKPVMDTRIAAANTYMKKYGSGGGNGGFGGFGDTSSKVSKKHSTNSGTTIPSGVYGGGSGKTSPSGVYGGFGGDVNDSTTNVADTSYMVNSDYINSDRLPSQAKPNKSKNTGYRNSGGYGQTISNGINNYNKKQSQKVTSDKDKMVDILTEMLTELKGTNVGINKFNDKEFNVNSPVYVSDTTNNNVVTKQDGQTRKKSETIKKKTSFVDKDSYSIAKKIASGRSYA